MEKQNAGEVSSMASGGQGTRGGVHVERDERLGANVHERRTTNIIVALKKTEKLTMALYMVTDVLPDREPLKWQLREGGTRLLSEVALTATAGASDKFFLWGRAETRIDEITALLDIAGITKMISEMNATVLKKEYLGLKYQIAVERESVGGHGGVTLSESFFAMDDSPKELTLPRMPHELMQGTVPAPGAHSKEVESSLGHEPAELVVVDMSMKTTAIARVEETSIESVPSTNLSEEHIAPAQIQKSPEISGRETSTAQTSVPKTEQATVLPSAQTEHEDEPRLENVPKPVAKILPTFPFERDIKTREVGPNRSITETSLKDLPVVTRPLASVIRPSLTHSPVSAPRISMQSHDAHESRLPSSSRRQVILEVLHQKPDLSVRDLVDKIEGYSEKTIQRELLAMVSDGVLRKQGERRWSRYSLAR